MKATITASPVFYLTLDKEIVSILMELANSHYDAVCKQAARFGGFLYGWNNCTEFGSDCQGTFHELDLSLKICELADFVISQEKIPTVQEYCKFVRKLISQSEQLCDIRLEITK